MDEDLPDLDAFVKDLQRRLDDEARRNYSDAALERWRDPPHHGRPSGATCRGVATGACGDTIEMFLRIKQDVVLDAGFLTDGCGASMICASMAAELARGLRPEDLLHIGGQEVCRGLGGLPADDEHCAHLAASALHEALGDHYARAGRKPEAAREPRPREEDS